MGQLGAVEFVTLDGVMQGFHNPDDEGGFRHGGWGDAYADETMFRAGAGGMQATTTYLLGRRTYEEMARFWPHQPDSNPIAAGLNRAPKYVATRTLEAFSWANTRRLEGDLVPAVQQLKASTDGGIVVLGSGRLAHQLFAANLVDHLRLFVHPLVLGSGRRLFPDSDEPLRLELEDATTSGTGVLILSYARAA
jgi:dihydrofolate reductase